MMQEKDEVTKQSIQQWWSENPMTYAREHGKTTYKDGDDAASEVKMGTVDFFKRVDKTFYSWNRPLHTKDNPFSKIFPYSEFRGKKVLEIGCGMGTMAMFWALNGANITATDLNPVSTAQTKTRFRLMGLPGQIVQMDANRIPLESKCFDYVYSWGVLHHSPNLELSVSEMFRVLRPGGKFGVMLYNRKSILYYYKIKYLEGFLHLENDFLNELQLASRYTDGSVLEGNPYTRPLTVDEVTELFAPYCSKLNNRLLGTELDFYLRLLIPGFGTLLPNFMKKPWARRYGWSIWIEGQKH